MLPDNGLTELRSADGNGRACTSHAELNRYARCIIAWDARGQMVYPQCKRCVGSTALCGDLRTEGRPLDSGRNWSYGTMLVATSGAVLKLLHRLDCTTDVDEESANKVIEPGVSYDQIDGHPRSCGHKQGVDCTDGSARGGVIGNALDRGVDEALDGSHFVNLCSLEGTCRPAKSCGAAVASTDLQPVIRTTGVPPPVSRGCSLGPTSGSPLPLDCG